MSRRPAAPFVLAVSVGEDARGARDYALELPAIRELGLLELDPKVTFLVGENGSGKSTLVEAIAVASRLNPEGGGARTRQTAFSTRHSHSSLHEHLVLDRSELAPLNAFFLRAESVYNLATAVEDAPMEDVYERPLHEQSHGESFLDIALNRLGPRGFYVLDEPEAALSVAGQLALMARMHELVQEHSQFVVATHSPILLGFPQARIYQLGEWGVRRIDWAEAPQVELTRSFLEDPQRFLHHLFAEDGDA